MKNSKLLMALETLNKSEWKELSAFVRSPFFNKRPDVVRLFEYIHENMPGWRQAPDKRQVYEYLFPGKVFDAQAVRQLMSWLVQLTEQYLAYQSWQQDPSGESLQLARAYRRRKLDDHFVQTVAAAEARQDRLPLRHAGYHHTAYLLQEERYQWEASQLRTGKHNLQEIGECLDRAFIARKLRLACLALAHQAVYKAEYEFALLEAVLEALRLQPDMLEAPAIAVYHCGYQALVHQDNAAFFQAFKQAIFRHKNAFPAEEWRDLMLLALNYCIRKLNEGQEQFAEEGLSLYQEGLSSGLLLSEGVLSRFTYRNIVAMGLKVGAFDWVERFIHQYKNALDKKHSESMYSFSLARLAYERNDLTSALGLLQKADYADLLLNLAAKTLLIKIYYKLDEWDPLQAHLDAMKNFIHRKRLMGYHRQNYLNMVRYTKKLLAVNPYDRAAVEALRLAISSEEILTEREWLLEQVEDL